MCKWHIQIQETANNTLAMLQRQLIYLTCAKGLKMLKMFLSICAKVGESLVLSVKYRKILFETVRL